MSLTSAICKIFAFVLKLFKLVVGAIAEAIKIILTAVVDVLDTLLDTIGETLFNGSSLFVLLGLGLFLFLGLGGDNEERKVGYEKA